MNDANELLDGLYYIRNLLEAMQKQNAEQQQLEAGFRQPVQLRQRMQTVPYRGRKTLIIVFLSLFIFSLLVKLPGIYSEDQNKIEIRMSDDEFAWFMNHGESGEPYPGYDGPTKASFILAVLKSALSAIPGTAVITLITGVVLNRQHKSKNMQIEKKNQEIDNWNQAAVVQNQEIEQRNRVLKEEIQKICNKKMMISEEYQKNVLSWFPKDYGYPSAVNYFINKIENHLAGSMVDLVQQYQEEQFRNRQLEELKGIRQGQEAMIQRQDKMIQQQMIGNLIGMANFLQLGNISNAANQRNIHLGNISDAANRMANKMERL